MFVSLKVLANFLSGAWDGIHWLGKHGVVHNDIKPQNFFVYVLFKERQEKREWIGVIGDVDHTVLINQCVVNKGGIAWVMFCFDFPTEKKTNTQISILFFPFVTERLFDTVIHKHSSDTFVCLNYANGEIKWHSL